MMEITAAKHFAHKLARQLLKVGYIGTEYICIQVFGTWSVCVPATSCVGLLLPFGTNHLPGAAESIRLPPIMS